MATASLKRSNTSVDIQLLQSGSGTPLISRDIGKPNLDLHKTGALNPRHTDQRSGLEQYTLSGKFTSNSAYSNAITLLDLIKSNSNGNALILNIDMPEYDTDINVVPAAGQEQACTVVYNPGWRDYVEVDLSLTRISDLNGGANQPANTPTTAGSGPLQISYNNTTVDLDTDVTVQRSVGRPESVVRASSQAKHPYYVDKYKTAYDGFEISFEITSDTITRVNNLVDMFSQKLGRNSLNLNFNGLFGMGSYNVVPEGSGALRQQRVSGEQGTNNVPTIKLRRVFA